MENLQTMENLKAGMRTTYENAMSMAKEEKLNAFMEELNKEEKEQYYVTLISHLSNRLKETEAKADFAALTITLAAVAAIGTIGVIRINEEIKEDKAIKEALDTFIEQYLQKQIDKDQLAFAVTSVTIKKRYLKYVNKMTNEVIFTKEKK